MSKRINPLAYYDEAEPRQGAEPGDYVELTWQDGGRAACMVAGAALTVDASGGSAVHILATGGARFRLTEADGVEIVTGAPRRSRG